jgi:hypothetical protein
VANLLDEGAATRCGGRGQYALLIDVEELSVHSSWEARLGTAVQGRATTASLALMALDDSADEQGWGTLDEEVNRGVTQLDDEEGERSREDGVRCHGCTAAQRTRRGGNGREEE